MTNADLVVYQGDDFTGVVSVMDATDAPADLTGYTAKAQIRKNVADREPAIAVEITATVMLPNLVILSIPNAETQALNGTYVWDVQIVSAAGVITTLLYGKVKLFLEVTRAEVMRGERHAIVHG